MRLRQWMPPALFLSILLLLLLNTSVAMDGIQQALSLCTQTLIPSLFPFLVFSELLIAMGGGRLMGHALGRPVGKLFGLSRNAASAILLGSVCGQPIGTVSGVSLYNRGEITKAELQRLTLFANNPSSGFLIGAVGIGLFKNHTVGIALFCITQLSAAIIGVSLHVLLGPAARVQNIPYNGTGNRVSIQDITQGVHRALSAMLQICAFVLFFSCIAACLSRLLSALILPRAIEILIYGMLELTSGISRSVTSLPPSLAFRAAACFAGFSGLSVCLQIFSVAREEAPSLLSYLLAKGSQSCVSLLLAECYLRVFDPPLTPTSAVVAPAWAEVSYAPVFMCCFLMCLFYFLQKKRQMPKGIC